jgi:membrane protein implicated in regulation of membrane protease activity
LSRACHSHGRTLPREESTALDPRERRRRARRILRYALFQVPGAALVAALLAAAADWWEWPTRWALLLMASWLIKDIVMYRFVAVAYDSDPDLDRDPLIGARGIATQPLDPSGYVRVGAELWRAVRVHGAARIPSGAPVRVRARRGLTLEVESDEVLASRT